MSSSNPGSFTSPAIDLSDASATYTLSFKACAWSNDATTLLVTVDGVEQIVEGLTNSSAPYAPNLKDFSLTITGGAESKITFASSGKGKCRFFLDDIVVTKLSSGETPDPSVTAPAAVDFGTITLGSGSIFPVSISGANLTEDLSVAVEGEAFSCATTTIPMDEAASATLEVVFSPEETGDYTGTLTISGGGLAEAKVVPLSGKVVQTVGQGTKENPYTVADVLKLGNPETDAWVQGYIVGSANGNLDKAHFGTGEGAVATNMLIADAADVQDVAACAPIELPRGEVRTALNLVDNPENLGKLVLLYGSLEAYFGVCGLKSITEYVLDGEEPEPVPTLSFAQATAIESGKHYAFAVMVDEAYKVAQPIAESSSYDYLDLADATYAENLLTTEEANAFVLTATEGGYLMQDTYGRYMYMQGTYNNFNVSEELPESGAVWTIDIAADGKATIKNATTGKWMQYDAQYSSFGAYDDERGELPVLYVESDGLSISTVTADDAAPVEVYTLGGVKVGNSLDGLQKGIYIVKQGDTVKKVMK